jgi:hypothetical protein
MVRHVSRALLVGALLLLSSVPVFAEANYPDFFGTILESDQTARTVLIDSDTDGPVLVDVSQLGDKPFSQGDFRPGTVLNIYTHRFDGRLVAVGWDLARNGKERSARG